MASARRKPHTICVPSFRRSEKVHYVQPGVGHYGVFNGTRWRTEIQPRIREFIRTVNYKRLTGGESTRIPQPYRAMKDTPDIAPDWRKPKGKTSLNGVNGKHPPAGAGE